MLLHTSKGGVNIDNLYELNILTISLRVFLSLILGGILGLERSRKNRPAGFRTYMLVCLGATLVMMTNQFIYNYFDGSDPARLGAQVISGIGFLGAGSIIVTRRNQVKGLTTAAGLWASACLGLAIGIGFYEGALIVGAATFIIMTMFKRLDNYLNLTNRNLTVYVSFPSIQKFDNFINYCYKLKIKITDIEVTRDEHSHEYIIAIISIEMDKRTPHVDIIQKLSAFEGLNHIEEI